MPAIGTALGLPFVRKAGPLTPPTLAPSLMVSESGGVATLDWTASNKTGSAGFAYRVSRDSGGGFGLITTTQALSYNDSLGTGTYHYKITPYNDAGDGLDSNTETIVIP